VQSKTIIDLLSNETTRQFIGLHLRDDVKRLALEANKYPGINVRASCDIIQLLQKASLKLPEHYKALAAFNAKSYEQCTSEAVAIFKASIMGIDGKHIVNISGGIGIDDWAMAKYAQKIDSCETDADIHSMAVFNTLLFNTNIITRHLVDGINYIKDHQKTDIIYADPDRRPDSGRIFRLEDSEPNVLSHLELLTNKADKIWLKVSPMADLNYLEKSIPNIAHIYVIALAGEVKEILISFDNRIKKEKKVVAVNIGAMETSIYEKRREISAVTYNNTGRFIYEPNRSIIKAGLSSDYADYCELDMLAPESNFFISNKKLETFQGRTFEVIERLLYKPRKIKSYLDQEKITQANITIRNFRETTEQLRLRLKLKDGGKETLCFTTDKNGEAWCFHCRAVQS